MIMQLYNHKISRETNIYHKINNKIFINCVFCIYEISAFCFDSENELQGLLHVTACRGYCL